jgi:release factor glutamine methyltransferase
MTTPLPVIVVEPVTDADRHDLERTLTVTLGSPREARWLIEDATGEGARPGTVSQDQAERARRMAERRATGEPLQYVLGHWPFRQLDLLVDSRALIPRPETEWVTDVALVELDRMLASGGARKVVDLGTGTGAIALSIATERAAHGVEVIATDRDPAVLELARINRDRVALRHEAARRVELRVGSWWAALDPADRGRISLAVANPPYVAAIEWELLDPVVRDHEPYTALVAGPGSDATPGFADIEAILAGAGEWLARPGAAVIEIAPTQAEAALAAAERFGSTESRVLSDLAGRPRALVARFG